MKNPTRPRNPYRKNPFDFSDPFEVPRRPRPAPAARRNPQSEMGEVIRGVTNVATIGMLGGVTVGILGAIPKSP